MKRRMMSVDQDSINVVLRDIKAEVKKQLVDLQDGSEEWRSYVNDTVLETLEIIDKYMIEED